MKGRAEDQNGAQRTKPAPFETSTSYMVDDRWTEFKIVGKNIQSRSHHIAVEYNGYLYVQGGYDADKGILCDFYKMDLNGKQDGFRWLAIPINDPNYPGKLKSHRAIVYKNQLIIFGGQTVQLKNTNTIWRFNFDTEKWSKVETDINMLRLDSHSVATDGESLYVYGGFIDNEAKYSSSIYKFNCSNSKWEVVFDGAKSKAPFPEARGSSTLILHQNSLWIFGGTNGDSTLSDMWRFKLSSGEWEPLKTSNTPQARRSHSMILSNGYFWMFGGIQDVTKQKNDIYIFDPKKLEWTKIMNASNMVYECSPTMKMQKNNHKRKDSPKKDSKFSLGLSASFNEKKESGGDGMKRILEENRQKKFQEKKSQLLREFVLKDNEGKERALSPTSESMLKTLEVIGDQEHTKRNFHNEIVYDPSLKFIVGKKPCARDAHTTLIYNDKMLIFGGDRHLMSFADLFFFDIKKGVESREVYKKHHSHQQ